MFEARGEGGNVPLGLIAEIVRLERPALADREPKRRLEWLQTAKPSVLGATLEHLQILLLSWAFGRMGPEMHLLLHTIGHDGEAG